MDADLRSRRIRSAAIASCFMAALVATGCSRDAQQESAGDVSATATPPAGATTAEAVRVANVELGRSVTDKRIADRTDDFRAADTVYASVQTTGSAQNASLMARWTYEDGQVVDESTQTIAPTGEAYTEFHISKPGGLPKGKYKVEVFLNGQSTSTKEFEVK